jgi:ribonuclease HI
LLLVHRNHQQDAARLSWEGLVAGTDGSVDERTECMGAGYVVGGDVLPLLTLSSRVGGPLASVRAEAASLLQLLRDVSTKYGRSVRLLIFIDCQVLLDILRKWGTHNFHPRPREVVHFDVIYPLLLELRQWLGDLVLMKIKSHTGCLLNERADEYAELGRTAEGPELCPGPQKYGSLWLRVKPIVREYAQQSRKSLPRDSAPNKSLIDKATVVNTYRAVYKRSTIFVKDLLHRSEGTTVSRVIRRCQPAVYRVWLKGMTGTYPTYTYLKRVGLAKSPDCPYCAAGVPETLTHFACVCPQFREARTSAHNQVRQVVSSFFSRCVGPKWTVYEETRMGNMGLNLSKVPAAVVATAGKQVVADSAGECDLQRWQPDWVAISYDHKRIAIIDLCRPSDVHEDQLEAAATLKQDGYTPLIRALDFYTARGWVVHVFPWVVGIRGLLHSSHICALLQFLEVPNKHWLSAMEGTVLASVNAFHFLHRVRFGGLPAGASLGSGLDQVDLGEDTSDLDASRMIRRCCKRRSPRSQDGGTISQRGSKRRKGHDPLCLPPSGGLCTSQAGPVLGDVTNSTLPCLAGNSMGESREAPQLAASPRASQQSQSQSAAGSIKNVRPPPLVHHPIHGSRATVHQQCHRDRRSRGGGRLRPSRMSANGIYDTNDPRSYISPARRQRTASQVDELWDRWRAVEVKKRRRT